YDDVSTGPVRMRLLVCADGELRDMARDRAPGHVEANVPAAGTAFLGRDQREIDGIRHKIGLQQKADLFALGAEIVRFSGETILEIIAEIEDEVRLLIEVDYRRKVGDADHAHHFLAGTVEMLIPAIERDGEDRPGLPFEGDAVARIVPHGR